MTPEEIQAYQQRALAAGRCIQCINPWFDGLCECDPEPTTEQVEQTDRVDAAAYALGEEFTMANVVRPLSAPNAYTVGHKGSYDASLASGEPVYKTGRTEDYEGGWIWPTRQAAEAFLAPTQGMLSFEGRTPVLCAVYGLVLPTGWEADVTPEPDPSDGVHRLLHDALILPLVQE